jgi:hypothetical protein
MMRLCEACPPSSGGAPFSTFDVGHNGDTPAARGNALDVSDTPQREGDQPGVGRYEAVNLAGRAAALDGVSQH